MKLPKTEGKHFLQRYGGKISSEWMIPKVWQILNEAPEIYEAADQIVEATDWVISQLTGELKEIAVQPVIKQFGINRMDIHRRSFLRRLIRVWKMLLKKSYPITLFAIGSKAGEITEKAAKMTGLNPGTAVAIANVDAHVSLPAVGITEPGKLLMIMGTSTCHILLGEEERVVPGMCGVVEDGVIPGYMGYEAGQSCVGDHFEWFTENCVPESYYEEAKEKGVNIHELLTEKASKLRVGESGLLALDWWNGNQIHIG